MRYKARGEGVEVLRVAWWACLSHLIRVIVKTVFLVLFVPVYVAQATLYDTL